MSKAKKMKRRMAANRGYKGTDTSTALPQPHPMMERIVICDVATYSHEGVTFDNLQRMFTVKAVLHTS